MRLVVLSAALCLANAAANAQQPPPAPACTYDRCALWLRDGRLQVGMPGTRLPGGAAGLVRLVASSDSALPHARVFERRQRTARRLYWIGTAAGVGSFASMFVRRRYGDPVHDDANAPEIIAMFGGAAAVYASIPFSISASRALQRSIWWYNRDLP